MTNFSKSQWFDLEGQDHLWVKVKFSLIILKVLSKGLFRSILKKIHSKIIKLWWMIKLFYGNCNNAVTVAIHGLLSPQKSQNKKRCSNSSLSLIVLKISITMLSKLNKSNNIAFSPTTVNGGGVIIYPWDMPYWIHQSTGQSPHLSGQAVKQFTNTIRLHIHKELLI